MIDQENSWEAEILPAPTPDTVPRSIPAAWAIFCDEAEIGSRDCFTAEDVNFAYLRGIADVMRRLSAEQGEGNECAELSVNDELGRIQFERGFRLFATPNYPPAQ